MTQETQKTTETVAQPAAAPVAEPDSDIVAIQVRNSRNPNTTRTLYKNKRTGKLVKSVRRDEHLSEDNHLRVIRNFLSSSKKKQINDTRREEILEAMYRLVTEDTDPKTASARANAAKFLFESGFGRTTSDSETKAAQSPVRVIVVEAPQIMHSQVIREEDRPKPPLKPAFAEVIDVQTNPPAGKDNIE